MSPTSKFACVAFLLLVLSHSLASVSATLYNKTCHRIAHALSSSSQVYYPGKCLGVVSTWLLDTYIFQVPRDIRLISLTGQHRVLNRRRAPWNLGLLET